MKTSETRQIPAKGLSGLKQNWKGDMTAGFLVFLLALPLSLGIAKASGFPPAMGVLTAMVGGLVTSLFKNVGELTIKGPAAGLITVSAGAVAELGDWHYAAAIVVIVGLIQIILSYLKVASLSDVFPISAIEGMLAAIGIIIIAKQIPVLLGDKPTLYKGEKPLELLADIPKFVAHEHLHIAIIGGIALALMFILPMIKIKWLQKVPAPMIVLIATIPMSIIWHIKDTEGDYSVVNIGVFWRDFGLNADFSKIATPAFWKYVVMFLFVNSLESLLTVKAVDQLDPYKRETDYNGDYRSVGAGNMVSGLLGGLPMISEVVRSSANVNYNAKTKWSNFFHGVFLLISMILLIPYIEMIPNAALAAMLMYAGYKLASPKTFSHMAHIGTEQLVIFLATIIVTLLEDLLLGIAVGIVIKLIFHLTRGAKFGELFKAKYETEDKPNEFIIHVKGVAVFTNLIGYKKILDNLDKSKKVIVDFSNCKLIDHSFLSFIHHVGMKFEENGGDIQLVGLENHKQVAQAKLSARVLK
jgi:MFS superfamily sulfate permease-like transporter